MPRHGHKSPQLVDIKDRGPATWSEPLRDVARRLQPHGGMMHGDGEIMVLRPGRYVICAVTGKKIPLEALRYWNPRLQEAYAGPAQALQRWQELQPKG